MKKLKGVYVAIVFVIIALVFVGINLFGGEITGKIISEDGEFARCLTEAGAEFYGASWCGHCQNQKEKFGSSLEYVNYIECVGSSGRNPECEKAGVKAYPTWKFSDGSKVEGEMTLEKLAEKTGCEL